jgi:NAD(P)-dependent dehydrogenase (short-subunit alcohol dehydrogenase family)
MMASTFSLEWFSLKGKTALVTGGNSGLGQAFSEALARAGANVHVSSIMPETGATRTLVENQGVRYRRLEADITETGAVAMITQDCIDSLGGIDILVNCAGISLLADVQDFGREQWDKMVQINLTAAFEFSHLAGNHMIKQGHGKIINICSLFSFLGGKGSPAYAATKHGIAGLTKAYCDELAQHNIQVNGIAPGYFSTALTQATFADPEKAKKILEHIPAGRLGTPQDLMGTIVFLASNASNYINGHILTVDGGYLVR